MAALEYIGAILPQETAAESKRCVVAIDFGSTHCGFAYAFTRQGDDGEDEPQIVAPVYRGRYAKQPTCALFEKSTEQLAEFGYDARERYQELIEQQADQDYLYFEGRTIKMRLFHGSSKLDMSCATVDGQGKMELIKVIGGILRRLKEEALEKIDLDASDVLWVVTVPSIWHEVDKQFMRKAAFHGGLVQDAGSADLILALEPECAIIATLKSDESGRYKFRVGDKVLTLDCGGGTVDICAVEILHLPEQREGKRKMKMMKSMRVINRVFVEEEEEENDTTNLEQPDPDEDVDDNEGKENDANVEENQAEVLDEVEEENLSSKLKLRHLLEPTGGNWGATNVDRNFLGFVGVLIDDPRLNSIRKENPGAVIELLDEWELIKTGLEEKDLEKRNDKKSTKSLNFACVLDALGEDVSLKKLVEDYNQKHQSRIPLKAKNTYLLLPIALILNFFEPILDKIFLEVDALLASDELVGLSHVVLVGGFGESVVLQKRLEQVINTCNETNKKEMKRLIRLVVPERVSALIEIGAVKYGLHPAVIATRRARHTIGVKVTMRQKDLVDDKENPIPYSEIKKHRYFNEDDKQYYVRDLFKPYVVKGQEIETAMIVRHTFIPQRNKYDRVKFDIYVTEKTRPAFVTDHGCIRLAKMVIDVDPQSSAEIQCIMRFASTEIAAMVKNLETQETRALMLQYNNLGLTQATGTVGTFMRVPVPEAIPWAEMDMSEML